MVEADVAGVMEGVGKGTGDVFEVEGGCRRVEDEVDASLGVVLFHHVDGLGDGLGLLERGSER